MVKAIDTRGKAMLTHFDNELTLYSHNQLYGRWFTAKRGEFPDTRRSLRVALHTRSHSALLYSASDISVLTPAQVQSHPFLSRLGPDVLDEGLGELEEEIMQLTRQAPYTLLMMRMVEIGLPILLSVFSFFFVFRYTLTEKRSLEIKELLKQRNLARLAEEK